MKIDKKKLRLGVWYEDKDGNIYKNRDGVFEKPNDKCITRYERFPLQIDERIEVIYDNKDTCRHPLKYRRRTGGWIKGIKGCECLKCGKTKTGKRYIPFAFMKWNDGSCAYHVMTTHISLSEISGDCAVAMVNSGDYTLDEALVVMASACERCSNVLIHKYLNSADGYEEHSEEWKKCNTFCDFCRDD